MPDCFPPIIFTGTKQLFFLMIYHIVFVQKVTYAHYQIPLLVVFGRVAMLPRQGQDSINSQEPEDPTFIQTPILSC